MPLHAFLASALIKVMTVLSHPTNSFWPTKILNYPCMQFISSLSKGYFGHFLNPLTLLVKSRQEALIFSPFHKNQTHQNLSSPLPHQPNTPSPKPLTNFLLQPIFIHTFQLTQEEVASYSVKLPFKVSFLSCMSLKPRFWLGFLWI